MKKIILTLVAIATVLTASADEGMWLPNLIGSRIKDMQAKGFKLSAEDIYSINQASLKDAVVLFNGGCTGELISSEGLLLTNHHCGYSQVQKHSTVEHDYLTNGFWAMSRAEELPNTNTYVAFLVRMEDVTKQVLKGVKTNTSAEERAEIIAKNIGIIKARATNDNHYTAAVESLYYGNQYFLFVYERFNDVRLVGAPPSSIGKFGGDTDNWMWPRHTGDFAIFRIYASPDNKPANYSAQNVPYRPKKHFRISTKGVEEGDFTWIYGFPGNTQRYITSDAVDYVLNKSNPMKIELRTQRLNIIKAAQESDPATRIKYASKHASIANAWKKWQGESKGLQRLGTIAKKQKYERDFGVWASSKSQFSSVLDSLHAAYQALVPSYYRREFYAESVSAVELARVARTISSERFKVASVKPMQQSFYKDYDVDVDRAIAKAMFKAFYNEFASEMPRTVTEEFSRFGGAEATADYIFDNSVLTSFDKLSGVIKDDASLDKVRQNDPMIKLLNVIDDSGYFAGARYRNLSNAPEIERWYRPYMQGIIEFDKGKAIFPDANLTLRVAYGAVGGYEYADGVYHRHYTTLDGIMEKDNPEIYDYDIPQRMREVYAQKDYGSWGIELDGKLTVPVAFIATNHTTGGNSGSPVLNAKGELLGLNFDRTWLSTMSDIEFDPDICRNIAVDIRYVLFVVDKIGGASYLFEEMDF